MRNVKRSGVLFAAVVAAMPVVSHAVVSGPTPVVLAGTPSPVGITFQGFFAPVINASGQVAFLSSVSDGTPSGISGLFAGTPGSWQAAAVRGTAAPGGAGTYNQFGSVGLNDAGQVGYLAFVNGGPGFKGIFAGAPGSVQPAAVLGTASPAGPNYTEMGNLSPAPVINNSGRVAYVANLAGGPDKFGLFAGAPGAVQTVGVTGGASPVGGNYTGFSFPTINDAGQVAFYAGITGGPAVGGIFAGSAGAVQAVALQGTAAPAGGNYAGPTNFAGNPVINGAGQVAFVSALTGGSSPSGVFAGAPGAMQTVALEGTAAPAGGNYTIFSSPVLDGAGRVAFITSLAGGAATRGIFTGSPGALQTVALQGTPSPDGIGNIDVDFDATAAMNGAGQVAFTSRLSGTGVTAANDNGLFVWSAGSLLKIIREGDTFDADPGPALDIRTVSGIQFVSGSGGEDGRAVGFNDSGMLVYKLSFVRGQDGIYSSAVPEPTGAAMLLVACAGATLRRRRAVPCTGFAIS
jgi:hypothetical protein